MNSLLYFSNILCASGSSALAKRWANNGGKASLFNVSKAWVGLLMFAVGLFWFKESLHWPTACYGAIYGVFLCISMFSGYAALACGPMALTSTVASFSLIIPFLCGVFVWNEVLTIRGVFGMLFLLIAIVLLNFKKEGGLTLRWSCYALLTLLSNGVCAVVQKQHQYIYPMQFRMSFMFVALLCVSIVLSVWIFLFQRDSKPAFSVCGGFAGGMEATANYIVLYLAATQKASVLFPLVSIAKLMTSWLLGRLFFKERLTKLQAAGVGCGLLAIFLLNH